MDWTFHYVEGVGEAGLGLLGATGQVLTSAAASPVPSIWEAVWAPLMWGAFVILDL